MVVKKKHTSSRKMKNQRNVVMVIAVSLFCGNGMISYAQSGNGEQANTDEKISSGSAIPDNVTDLKGEVIDFKNRDQYLSTGRPWVNDKMFLFYNVGTGKFLNVGSYWGTHAVLSEVPKPFWLQNRNDKEVSGQSAYERYPMSKVSAGNFQDEFNAISKYEIGSTEGTASTARSNAIYQSIAIKNLSDDSTYKVLKQETTSNNGQSFKFTEGTDDFDDLDFDKQYVEAYIDLSPCTNKDAADGTHTMETILSIGENIDKWQDASDNQTAIVDVHMYGYVDSRDDHMLRVQCVNSAYKNDNQKTKVNITNTASKSSDGKSSNIAHIIIKKNSITVNGVECMPKNYENPIQQFLKQTSIQVGSAEGTGRSNATYNYVKLFTSRNTQSTADTCVVKPGFYNAQAGNGDELKFSKTYEGNLSDHSIYADIDLSTCTDKNENVLSIGTDIDHWGNKDDGVAADAHNLHFYYTKGEKLVLNFVSCDGQSSNVVINQDGDYAGRLQVELSIKGLEVNGKSIADLYNVLSYLRKTASSLQVGSTQGTTRSHAIYKTLKVVEAAPTEINSTPYPTMGTQWTGEKFDKTVYGNLSDHVVEAEIDLSTCTSGANENVLSIGNAIDQWGTKSGQNNIHMYYNGTTLSIEGVNSTHTGGKTDPTIKASLAASGMPNKIVKVKIDKNGLFINDAAIRNFGSDNEMIKYLASESTTQIQVGSREGATRSHATYKSITASYTETLAASATAKTMMTAANAATGTESTESSETTSTLDTYIPIYNEKGDGKTAMKSDLFKIDWENGDYIEADIDVSTCQNSDENVLSIGSNIGIWGYDTGSDVDNLHIFFGDKTADGVYSMKVYYVNNTQNVQNLRNFTIQAANDGSAKMHVKLSKEGLVINDSQIYTATNPMPTIAYDESLKGTIVKFKYNGSVPALDSFGQYIIVKPGEDGYADAKGIKGDFNGYIYTEDNAANNDQPVFITSTFLQEGTSNYNEGDYFAWAPYLKNNDQWGNIGIFGDRNLPQKEVEDSGKGQSVKCSQWHFVKVQDGDKNTYQIYLDMDKTKVPKRTGSANGREFEDQSGKFYLQACEESVYGNSLENYGGGWDDTKAATNSNGVDAKTTLPSGEDIQKSYWRLIDVEEYYQLFKSANSEMSNMLNLSYSLRDPDFMRESNELTKWECEGVFAIEKEKNLGTNNQLNIGFDQYSKKAFNDTEYTDEDGNKYTNQGATDGNDTYKFARQHVNNHGRYMGVEVKNGGRGTLSQTVKVYNPGWYAINCGGVSNVGAKLFATYTLSGKEHTITQDLHNLTDDEKTFFNATNHTWPYDQASSTLPLPMYNALVAMNDDQAPDVYNPTDATKNGAMVETLKSQVAFYIDKKELPADGSGVNVTFGVKILDDSQVSTQSAETSNEGTSTTAVSTADEWTVFDNFHLLFGGDSQDPNIVFSEDFTNLDYYNNSIHNFQNRPMRLYRTFNYDTKNNKAYWNSLVLPVTLSKTQFEDLLGKDAELLKISKIKGTKLIFEKETESATEKSSDGYAAYFRANKPYLVKVHSAKGQEKAYDAYIYNYADGGKTYTKVSLPESSYVCFNVTLPTTSENPSTSTGYYNGYSTQDAFYTTIDGTKYHYVVNQGDEDVAYDYTSGEKNENRYATFYGTLCKTYEGKSIINNGTDDIRPDLSDGNSYYMGQGSNFYLRKQGAQYGQKGFRCWFVYHDGTASASQAKPVMLELQGITEETTDIDAIERNDGETIVQRYKGAVYNLNGQKVASDGNLDNLPAGIYIVNGRKVIVK